MSAEEERFTKQALFSAKEIELEKQKQKTQERLNQLQAQADRDLKQQLSG